MVAIRDFTGREREQVRQILLEKGKQFFSRYGVRKTSIDELTKSAGIAKGSFYSFFASKEELYFRILTEEIRQSIPADTSMLDMSDTGMESPKQMLKQYLKYAVESMNTNPIFMIMLNREEYDAVYRKVMSSGMEHPEAAIVKPLAGLLSRCQKDGVIIGRDTEMLSNVVKCLFLLTTHKEEIGLSIFPDVMDFLIDLVAGGFTGSIS